MNYALVNRNLKFVSKNKNIVAAGFGIIAYFSLFPLFFWSLIPLKPLANDRYHNVAV
jgi:hypothetical protein